MRERERERERGRERERESGTNESNRGGEGVAWRGTRTVGKKKLMGRGAGGGKIINEGEEVHAEGEN